MRTKSQTSARMKMKYEVTGAVNRLGRAEEVDEVDLGNFAERGSMGTTCMDNFQSEGRLSGTADSWRKLVLR